MASDDCSILVVCTGNLCRSPIGEHLLRSALGPKAGITVGSAGTLARPGQPMAPYAASVLDARGISTDRFVSRPLAPGLVADAALVLTATRDHRAAVVGLHPPAVARTFTLAEFARAASGIDRDALSGTTPGARLRALVPVAAARRGLILASEPSEDDLADPLGEAEAAFTACAGQIDSLLASLVALLG